MVGERKKMRELINRLVTWLEAKGISDEDIIQCIKFITKK